MKTKLLSALLIAFFQLITAQNSSIYFQGETIRIDMNIDTFQVSDIPANKVVNQGFYGWVQFTQIPSQELQNQFIDNNLELINYIDNKTYLFYFPINVNLEYLKNSGVRAILPMRNKLKMSSNVKNNTIGTWALEGNNVLLNIQHFKNLNTDVVVNKLNEIEGILIKNQYKNNNNLTISIPNEKIEDLVNIPLISWVELIQEPSIKDDVRGRSIHRASNLDTQIPGGRNYTGEGIGVMVRDDGIVGPHIDYQGRIDNSGASGTGQTHGDGVGGIMAGAGNLDPTMRGMAAGSNVFIVNYQPSFLDTQTTNLINDGSVQITNSSYSNGCNAGYTTIANTVDQQTIDTPSLLHVFSAGNSNGNDCGYGAGNQWGNITGGHKQGKNVIATANVFFDGSLANSSSHGPAHDGRIKPDITAHGQGQMSTDENNAYLSFGGTSGAAPGIAGVSAQLYQLYKEVNGGVLPESGLIKATMLNTANDYGNLGPDFKFGWGVVNGLRAGMLLEDQRYFDSTVTQGNNNNHTINVPAGTTQVRFMVYWTDPAASAGANTALVNDLDLKVTSPSNTESLPWVLDSTPNASTLDNPATTGVDRLNNMEQVLINSPEAGDYTININGFNVPQGPQKYYVVYEIIPDELVLTYPQGGEKITKGENHTIHWDATNITNNIVIDYSSDNGGTWSNITTVSSTFKNYTWSIPTGLDSGEYLMRITSGSFTSQSQPFSLANVVSGVNVTQVCPETLSVGWDTVSGATSYKVYLLGDKFMEEVGTSTSTSLSISITDPNEDFWVAVSALGSNWESRRSIAINQSGGLLNCALANDVGIVSVQDNFSNLLCDNSSDVQITTTILNTGTAPQTGFILSYQLDGGTIVEETYTGTLNNGVQENYTFTTPVQITTDGNHTLLISVSLTGDENSTNNEQILNFYTQITGADLNVAEGFETSFPAEGWSVGNPDSDGFTWQEASVVGSDGNNTKVAFVDHADYTTRGREDYLITKVYDLSNTSSPELKFDLAKAQWSASYNDKLRVEVSVDCGGTYVVVYEKEGLVLSTIANYTASEWTPASGADWREEVVDLSSYIGEKVQIRFVAVNDYSNSTYVDNIEVSGVLSIDKETLDKELLIYPNPTSDKLFIKLKNSQKINKINVYSVLGKEIDISNLIKESNLGLELDMNTLSSGIYIIRVQNESGFGYRKIIKE